MFLVERICLLISLGSFLESVSVNRLSHLDDGNLTICVEIKVLVSINFLSHLLTVYNYRLCRSRFY